MTWDLGSPGNVQFWGSTRWFLPTFSRGHWTSLHCFTWDPKWFSPFSMFPPGGETKKTFTKAAQTKRHGETGKPFDFWSGQILLATSRGLKPQKACTFLDGKWDPLFQGNPCLWNIGEISKFGQIDGLELAKDIADERGLLYSNPSTTTTATTTTTTSNLQVNHQTFRLFRAHKGWLGHWDS